MYGKYLFHVCAIKTLNHSDQYGMEEQYGSDWDRDGYHYFKKEIILDVINVHIIPMENTIVKSILLNIQITSIKTKKYYGNENTKNSIIIKIGHLQ